MKAIKNTIPPITDPLGRSWEQPNTSEILIDDTHAVMTEKSFNRLHNYETTYPSGVYPGKMWRCGNLLRWFDYHEDPNYCSNHQREIIIL